MTDEQPGQAASPAGGVQKASRTSNILAIIGWITAVFFPPIGLVFGGILASQDDKRGRWILGVAGVMILLWVIYLVVLLNATEDAQRNYYYE